MPDVLKLQQAAASETKQREPGFGRAKAIILIHLYGSPSQLEWVDPKPDAPESSHGRMLSGLIPPTARIGTSLGITASWAFSAAGLARSLP